VYRWSGFKRVRSQARSILLWALAIAIIAVIACFDHEDERSAPAKIDAKRPALQETPAENP